MQLKLGYFYGKTVLTLIASGIHVALRKDWALAHISHTAGIARHVRTDSAVAPFPPRPAFNLGLCMSNLTNLAIAVQYTTETSNRPLHMLEIAQTALKERVKIWAAIITRTPTKTGCFVSSKVLNFNCTIMFVQVILMGFLCGTIRIVRSCLHCHTWESCKAEM